MRPSDLKTLTGGDEIAHLKKKIGSINYAENKPKINLTRFPIVKIAITNIRNVAKMIE